ncbi:MAG: SRPBCC family protein [Myxococcaceae bacterium]|jgi:lactoylglutathione lyase|nr:SRPBCC family protein [Myxococcaceae bacterium]
MFQKDFSSISTATPETLWPHYADVSRWKVWDEAVEQVTLAGAFAVGSRGTLKMHGRPALDFTLTEVTPNVSFSDETKVGPMTVRFTHTLQRLTGGTKVTHRVTIDGPGAETLGGNMHVQQSVDTLARIGTKATPVTLGGVILYTPDLEKKVAFYEQAFGFEVASRAPGGVYVQLKGSVPLAFVAESFVKTMVPDLRASRPNEAPAAAELMLVFADVDAAYARALKSGAVAVVAPVTKPWGQVVSYVRDVDGALVELCTPWE